MDPVKTGNNPFYFESDVEAHKLIQERAKAMVEFLQIDNHVLFNRVPHLLEPEPYKFDSHITWVQNTRIGDTLDHTLLKPDATQVQYDQLCQEARDYGIRYICVPGDRLEAALQNLSGSNVNVACVMAFPHGNSHYRAKQTEAEVLLGLGATELDTVISIGMLKEKKYYDVQRDVRVVVEKARQRDASRIVKIILETCLLTKEEVIDACLLCVLAGAQYVKTSTGFSTGGASKEVVRLMKLTVGDTALVKASGGVRTYEDAKIMLENGASRIGTSAGVTIVKAASTDAV